MLFTANTVSEKEIKSINNFFDEFENQVETVSEEENTKETSVSLLILTMVRVLLLIDS